MTSRQPGCIPNSKLYTAWPGSDPGPDSNLTPSLGPTALPLPSPHPTPIHSQPRAQAGGPLLLALKGKGVPRAQPSCAHCAPACVP